MKSIILIIILIAILILGNKALILDSEPVALIFLGVCLIGMAKIGRNQINNKMYRHNWQIFKLLVENALLKKQIKS
jgi:hypothetical protein